MGQWQLPGCWWQQWSQMLAVLVATFVPCPQRQCPGLLHQSSLLNYTIWYRNSFFWLIALIMLAPSLSTGSSPHQTDMWFLFYPALPVHYWPIWLHRYLVNGASLHCPLFQRHLCTLSHSLPCIWKQVLSIMLSPFWSLFSVMISCHIAWMRLGWGAEECCI